LTLIELTVIMDDLTPIDDGTPMNEAPIVNGGSEDITDARPPCQIQSTNPVPNPIHSSSSISTQSNLPLSEAVNDDNPDALPKFFKDKAAGDNMAGVGAAKADKSKVPVDAWSSSDTYSLNYASMGKFVIINNRDFDPRTGMGLRNGTDVDAENLMLRFKELGFEVVIHQNQKAEEIKSIFQSLSREDHSSRAAFGCAILSHGEEGVIYGTDRQLDIENITKPFRGDRCKSLVGKPKIFFIQACRGNDLMDGVPVPESGPFMTDAREEDITERLPVESDFLIAYSVVPGYFSWRNSLKGSWFIQALCNCLDKFGKSLDLLKLLVRVNKRVALDFESNTSNRDMHKKKQIPCITCMLTKDLYLVKNPKIL